MPDLEFFDIPIYRLPESQYYEQREKYINSVMRPDDGSENSKMKISFYDRNPADAASMKDHLGMVFGGLWDYNEIVGYIRLLFLGSQVRGELWMVDAKRIVKSRTKTFVYKGDKVVYEEDLNRKPTNANIFQSILAYLERAKKKLKGRYVDTELFERVGKHIDWMGMIEEFGTY